MLFLYQLLRGKTFWASLTHALMSVGFFLSIYLVPSEKLLLAQISLFNSLLYFLADFLVRPNPTKIIHHIICSLGCVAGLYLSPEITIFTAKLCGLIETSNPPWAFLRLRLENSDEIPLPTWYTKFIAGGVFTFIFFIVRFIWFPIVLYYETPDGVPNLIYHLTLTPFHLLNLYWLMLLIRGFIRELRKKAPSPSPSPPPPTTVTRKKRKPRYCD